MKKRTFTSKYTLGFLFTLLFALSAQPNAKANSEPAKWEKSVAIVLCKTRRGTAMGTGFLIDKKGHIITNHHVVQSCLSNPRGIQVAFSKDEIFSVWVIKQSKLKDIALLKIKGKTQRPALPLYNGPKLAKGDKLWAIGFPGAASRGLARRGIAGILKHLNATITDGTVSRLTTDQFQRKVIQTNTPINRGNSGGPMLNDCGHVVGISTFVALDSEGIKFAVSTQELIPFLKHTSTSINVIRKVCKSTNEQQDSSNGVVLALVLGCLGLSFSTVFILLRKKQSNRTRYRARQKPKTQASSESSIHPRSKKTTCLVLYGLAGEYAQASIPLDFGILIIGRDPSLCGLVFPANVDGISRRHAEIKVEKDGNCWLKDCWSTSGTQVNGKAVEQGQWNPLPIGSEISLGNAQSKFRLQKGG